MPMTGELSVSTVSCLNQKNSDVSISNPGWLIANPFSRRIEDLLHNGLFSSSFVCIKSSAGLSTKGRPASFYKFVLRIKQW